jgi:hypothetical protein
LCWEGRGVEQRTNQLQLAYKRYSFKKNNTGFSKSFNPNKETDNTQRILRSKKYPNNLSFKIRVRSSKNYYQ